MAKVFLRAYNREIETMIDRGQLDEAIAHCHHILKTFPKHLETYRLLGKAYLEGKRYGDAVDIFSRIIASVPNDFVAHVGMSIIRDEENKLDDAIWHMERAFEVQPSNAAIQSELQRLYGRRDGVQPPRIRMTRGALAHMYVQGELYPQAISEIKSVLSEDPGRSDMQALLARAYFKSGAKNDAVDAALVLLQRYPYSIDANRVLAEVLSADRNENAQSYRQRVVELDPYAGQVSGSIFLSNEVSEAAVALERLDWNGQPVGMQDWREQQAISPESGTSRGEQPDWMSSPFGETAPPQPTTGSMFDMPASSPAQPADEIPDFMKAAGWGESTGAFDESKPIFAEQEPAGPVQPIAEGDLPDWVKAMKPAEPETATPAEAEELPDWINQIGTGALSASTAEQSDWPGQPEQTSQSFAAPSGDEPDWLKGFGEAQEPAQASQDQPDWLKGFGSETESAAQPAESDTPDWLKGLGEEPQTADASAIDGFDWLQGVGSEPESTLEPAQAETPDWLKGTESAPAAEADNLDWLKAIGDAESTPQPAATETPDWLKATEAETASATDDLDWLKGSGESESQPAAESSAADLDWLQGIGEEADITPQPAQVETPDWLKGIGEPEPESAPAGEADDEWLKQFGSSSEAAAPVSEAGESKDLDFLNELTQEPVLQTPEEATRPTSSVEDLGKSTQEQDDSFAWLESLAAKQGASEGLLTKPEERLEYEPEWVKQAKGLTGEVPSAQPAASVEELGKSAQEQDDSFAWLESLAAKQGASEGLLTKPEERMEQEPEWVRQAKGLTAVPASQTPANVEELGKSTKEQDDSFAWLENLAAKQGATEGLLTKPEERMQEEPEWVKQAKSAPVEPPVAQDPAEMEELGKSEQEKDDSFAWLENLAAQQGASEGLLTEPEERLQEDLDWVEQSTAQAETPVSQPESKVEELGTSEQERDDAFAWLESLAAKHGASEGLLTKPEERLEQEPEWVRQSKDIEAQELTEIPAAPSEPIEEPVAEQPREEQPVIEQPASASDTGIWLQRLVEEEKTRPEPAADETEIWLRSLEGRETEPAQSAAEPVESELPAWMENIEQDETLATEAAAPERMETPLQESAEDSGLPSWLSDLEKEEQVKVPSNADDLPAWLRDETGDVVAEPVKIEPTRPSDWKPAEEKQPEIVYSPPLEEPQQPPVIYSPPLEETPQPEPVASVEAPQEQEPVAVPVEEQPKLDREPAGEVPAGPGAEPYREPVTTSRGTGMPVMAAAIDQTLGNARSEFSRSNIPGGLDLYAKLIKKGRFLDEVIYDLREALYRFPVEVNIWQALGDAYMRANRLQDALDAYTKAEELLR